MTNEELCTAIQRGNTEEITQLWEQTKRFIYQQARRRAAALDGFGGVEVDDLVNAGYVAMTEAVETFDAEAGLSFIGWLMFHLRREFAKAAGYRSTRRDALNYSVDIDDVVPGTDDLKLVETLEDPLAETDFDDVERKVWNDQLHEALMAALGDCTEDQKVAVVSHWFNGETRKEIAASAGVSSALIEQREKRAFRTIRDHAHRSGLDQFVDLRTDFYHVGKEHSIENVVLHREQLVRDYYNGKQD